MKTFIFTLDTIDEELPFEFIANSIETLHNQNQDLTYAWEVNPGINIEEGDSFYIVSTVDGMEGICGAGYISCEPYEDEDEGKPHFFVDLEPLVLVNPATANPIDVQKLKKIIAETDLSESQTGVAINNEQAELIDLLWLEYLYDNQDAFDGIKAAKSWDFNLENFETVTGNLQNYLIRTRGQKCENCGKTESDREILYHLVLGENHEPGTLHEHLHCYCEDCWFHKVN